jgi:hypothetical protein
MAAIRWGLLGLSALLAVAMWWSYASAQIRGQRPQVDQGVAKYRCPMHPQITSPQPGECPICHMTLEPAGRPIGQRRNRSLR